MLVASGHRGHRIRLSESVHEIGSSPVAPGAEVSDEDFRGQLETLSEELETLNAQARELEETITRNVAEILEA